LKKGVDVIPARITPGPIYDTSLFQRKYFPFD
jgi:hypothetical protein